MKLTTVADRSKYVSTFPNTIEDELRFVGNPVRSLAAYQVELAVKDARAFGRGARLLGHHLTPSENEQRERRKEFLSWVYSEQFRVYVETAGLTVEPVRRRIVEVLVNG